MKTALQQTAIVGIIVAVLGGSCLSSYLYFKAHSEAIASEKVRKYCKDHGYDFNKLTGPGFSHTLGIPKFDFLGCDFHPAVYGWNNNSDKDSKNSLACDVWFDFFYEPHLIVWDMPNQPVWNFPNKPQPNQPH